SQLPGSTLHRAGAGHRAPRHGRLFPRCAAYPLTYRTPLQRIPSPNRALRQILSRHNRMVFTVSLTSSRFVMRRTAPVNVLRNSSCALVYLRALGGFEPSFISAKKTIPPKPNVISHAPFVTWTETPIERSAFTISVRFASVRAARLTRLSQPQTSEPRCAQKP